MQQLLENAILIAIHAHLGKVDKGGCPYILHPLRVMINMETIEEKIVAVLHDVIEDSNKSIQSLRDSDFPEEILTALSLLTKQENQDYEDYIFSIKKNELATKVKIADLLDNMNMKRIQDPTYVDIERFRKYQIAYNKLIES